MTFLDIMGLAVALVVACTIGYGVWLLLNGLWCLIEDSMRRKQAPMTLQDQIAELERRLMTLDDRVRELQMALSSLPDVKIAIEIHAGALEDLNGRVAALERRLESIQRAQIPDPWPIGNT